MAIIREDDVNVEEDEKVCFFKKVKEILEENNIEYWLAFGALLGYVREKHFIPWDHDIDIGTLDISKIEELESKFKDRKLTMKVKYRDLKYETTTVQIRDTTLPKETKFHIDIYEFSLRDGKPVWKYMVRNSIVSRIVNAIYNALKSPPSSKKMERYNKSQKILVKFTNKIPCFIRPSLVKLLKKLDEVFADKLFLVFPKLKIQTVNFYGMKVKIPVEPEKHLKVIYGENWKNPDKSFSAHGIEAIRHKEGRVKVCELEEEDQRRG